LIRGGYRFAACAKPGNGSAFSWNASAGEDRPEKMMLEQAKAKYRIILKSFYLSGLAKLIEMIIRPYQRDQINAISGKAGLIFAADRFRCERRTNLFQTNSSIFCHDASFIREQVSIF
jgi:hypothetical protein